MRVLLPLQQALAASQGDNDCNRSINPESSDEQSQTQEVIEVCFDSEESEEVDTPEASTLDIKPTAEQAEGPEISEESSPSPPPLVVASAVKEPPVQKKSPIVSLKASTSFETTHRPSAPTIESVQHSVAKLEDSKRPGTTLVATKDISPPPAKKPRVIVPGEVLKPAAKETPKKLHKKKMGGGRRKSPDDWSQGDDDCRDAAPTNEDFYENDPASARGDVPLSKTVDQLFEMALKKRGLEIREQEGDGNCLFRAVSLQVYGDPSMHGEVRQRCLDFMAREEAHFSQFVVGEPFKDYIERKRRDGEHGNNPEIQAISELFNRPVEVFVPDSGATPLNIFHADYKTGDQPIRLSYHDGNHYNAVVDPLVPTAGLGLGLPGLQPGMADKMQLAQAVAESDQLADQMEFQQALKKSEDDELQRAIKDSSLSADFMYQNQALALSDLDATNFELEQAALVSSLQSYSNNEHGRKQSSSYSHARRRRPGRNSPADDDDPPIPQHSPPHSSHTLVASLPSVAHRNYPIPHAAAASASVASAASGNESSPQPVGPVDEYPQTVQELVMNGFDLKKVVHAYGLIGDNFDDLLAFLMSNATA